MTDAESKRLQARLSQHYKETNKQVKRLVQADRHLYADILAAEAEEAAAKRKHEQIYKVTKLVCGKHCNKLEPPLKNKG